MSEFESAEDIKVNMEVAAEEAKQQESVVNEEQKNEEPKPKLSLSERLDNAHKKLDEEGKQAWSQGWRPEEFFAGKRRDGSERPFIDAKEFLSKTKDALPVANDRIRELTKQIEESNRIAKEAKEAVIKAEEKGYQKAVDDLDKKQREAAEVGDIEEFDKLKQQERELFNSRVLAEVEPEITPPEEELKQPQQKPEAGQLSPRDQEVFGRWQGNNNWFSTDPKLRAYAVQSESLLMEEKPYLSFEERLSIVEQEIKETFPSKFGISQSRDVFESGSNGGYGSSAQKVKGYNDLSPEAKKGCENLIKIRGIDQKGGDAVKRFRQTYAQAVYK